MHAGNIHKGYNKSRVHFYFWSRCCCCCYVLLRAADAAHNICTQATRGFTFSFSVVALLLLFTHREGCAEKNKIGCCFLLDAGTQSIAFSVVMVVDCAAVERGCMLEKYVKVATKYVLILIFGSRCCCCCCCVLLLLPTTSVLKRREVPATVSSFSVSATTTAVSFASILLLLLRLRRDACRKKQTKNVTLSFLVA